VAHRTRIGIPFNYDENWIGGAYYVLNLVSAFNLLPEPEQPDVYVLAHTRHSYDFIAKGSAYPRCEWVQPARLSGIDGGIFRKLRLLLKVVPSFLKRPFKFDVIYPFPIDRQAKETICWIPDLQEKHFPDLFDPAELQARDTQVRYFFENFQHVVFSSESARSDFHRFYPEAKCQTHVVHFAVFNPIASKISPQEIRAKYHLPERFFYCPNQFWVHKNHKVVIEAVALLKNRGTHISVVFSGKEHDHRAPDHAQALKEMAKSMGVADRIRFLGFLPRDEQVVLFTQAAAIIQPSLFEGWSTVIEDAKAISQYVIASDLAVNREQLSENVSFFDPHDMESLADNLNRFANADPPRETRDYRVNQRAFASDFMRIAQIVSADGNR
jgi:glycosyltransferase involved in cell wall biosynthesis